jgi:hypothetical protein
MAFGQPFSITAIIPNIGAARLSVELGTKGPLSFQGTRGSQVRILPGA